MPFQLKFTIEGETQLSRNLLLVATKIKDWTPAFQETALTLQSLFSGEVFDTQGAVIDESWSPLKKAYVLQKSKKKGVVTAKIRVQSTGILLAPIRLRGQKTCSV